MSMAFPGGDWEEACPQSRGVAASALEAAPQKLAEGRGADARSLTGRAAAHRPA